MYFKYAASFPSLVSSCGMQWKGVLLIWVRGSLNICLQKSWRDMKDCGHNLKWGFWEVRVKLLLPWTEQLLGQDELEEEMGCGKCCNRSLCTVGQNQPQRTRTPTVHWVYYTDTANRAAFTSLVPLRQHSAPCSVPLPCVCSPWRTGKGTPVGFALSLLQQRCICSLGWPGAGFLCSVVSFLHSLAPAWAFSPCHALIAGMGTVSPPRDGSCSLCGALAKHQVWQCRALLKRGKLRGSSRRVDLASNNHRGWVMLRFALSCRSSLPPSEKATTCEGGKLISTASLKEMNLHLCPSVIPHLSLIVGF